MNKSSQKISDILEGHGRLVAERAKTVLLNDPALKNLKDPLLFINQNWNDLTPALMALSCEAVGGNPAETHETALAFSLLNLSFTTFDDIIDNALSKSFKPTLVGKFGANIAIIIGGVASAKAFTLLNETSLSDDKKIEITQLFWQVISTMTAQEAITQKLRTEGTQSSDLKFKKIFQEAIDLSTCLKIGALIGGGSNEEINHLDQYGRCLGVNLALRNDFEVSVNLTLELLEKIRSKRLPYLMLLAMEQSPALKLELDLLESKKRVSNHCVKKLIEDFLETGIFNQVLEKMRRYQKKGEVELTYLKDSNARKLLNLLIALQHQTISESFRDSQIDIK